VDLMTLMLAKTKMKKFQARVTIAMKRVLGKTWEYYKTKQVTRMITVNCSLMKTMTALHLYQMGLYGI